jgi:hypothetical protein
MGATQCPSDNDGASDRDMSVVEFVCEMADSSNVQLG